LVTQDVEQYGVHIDVQRGLFSIYLGIPRELLGAGQHGQSELNHQEATESSAL